MKKLLLFFVALLGANALYAHTETITYNAQSKWGYTFNIAHSASNASTPDQALLINLMEGTTTRYAITISHAGQHEIKKLSDNSIVASNTVALPDLAIPSQVSYWVAVDPSGSARTLRVGYGQFNENEILSFTDTSSDNKLSTLTQMEIVENSGIQQFTSGQGSPVVPSFGNLFAINARKRSAAPNRQEFSFQTPGGVSFQAAFLPTYSDSFFSAPGSLKTGVLTAPGTSSQICTHMVSAVVSPTNSSIYTIKVESLIGDSGPTTTHFNAQMTTSEQGPAAIMIGANAQVANLTFPDAPIVLHATAADPTAESALVKLGAAGNFPYFTFEITPDSTHAVPLGIVLADGTGAPLYEFQIGLNSNKSASLILHDRTFDSEYGLTDASAPFNAYFTASTDMTTSTWERDTPKSAAALADPTQSHVRFDYLSSSARSAAGDANIAYTLPTSRQKMFVLIGRPTGASDYLTLTLGKIDGTTHTTMLTWRSPVPVATDSAAIPQQVRLRIPEDKFATSNHLTSSGHVIVNPTPFNTVPAEATIPPATLFDHLAAQYAAAGNRVSLHSGEQQSLPRTLTNHRLTAVTDTVPATWKCSPSFVAGDDGSASFIISFGENTGETIPLGSAAITYGIDTVPAYPVQMLLRTRRVSGSTYTQPAGHLVVRGADGTDTQVTAIDSIIEGFHIIFDEKKCSVIQNPNTHKLTQVSLPSSIAAETSAQPQVRYHALNGTTTLSDIVMQPLEQTPKLCYSAGSLSFETSTPTFDTITALLKNGSSLATQITLKGELVDGIPTYNAILSLATQGSSYIVGSDSGVFTLAQGSLSDTNHTRFTINTSDYGVSVTAGATGAEETVLSFLVSDDNTPWNIEHMCSLSEATDGTIDASSITTTLSPDMSAQTSSVGVTEDPSSPGVFTAQGTYTIVYETGTTQWRDYWLRHSNPSVSFDVTESTEFNIYLGTDKSDGSPLRIKVAEDSSVTNLTVTRNASPIATQTMTTPLSGTYTLTFSEDASSGALRIQHAGEETTLNISNNHVLQALTFSSLDKTVISNITNAGYKESEPTLGLSAEQSSTFILTNDLALQGADDAAKSVSYTFSGTDGSYTLTTTVAPDVGGTTLTFALTRQESSDPATPLHERSLFIPDGVTHHATDWLAGTTPRSWLSFDNGVFMVGLGADSQADPLYSFADPVPLGSLQQVATETTNIAVTNTVISTITTRPVIYSERTTTDVPREQYLFPVLAATATPSARLFALAKNNQSASINYTTADGSEKMFSVTIEGDTLSLYHPNIPAEGNILRRDIPADATEIWVAFSQQEEIALGTSNSAGATTALLYWGTPEAATFSTIGVIAQGGVGASYSLADFEITDEQITLIEALRTTQMSSTEEDGVTTLRNLYGAIITNEDGSTWKYPFTQPLPDTIEFAWDMTATSAPAHIILGTTNSGSGTARITLGIDSVTLSDPSNTVATPQQEDIDLPDLSGSYRLSYFGKTLSLVKDDEELFSLVLSSADDNINVLTFSNETGSIAISNTTTIERESKRFSTQSAPVWLSADSTAHGTVIVEGVLKRDNSSPSHCLARIGLGTEESPGSYSSAYHIDLIQSEDGTTVSLKRGTDGAEFTSVTDASLVWNTGTYQPFSLMYTEAAGQATISFSLANKKLISEYNPGVLTAPTHASIGSFQPATSLGTYSTVTFDNEQSYTTAEQLTAYFGHMSETPHLFWRDAHHFDTPGNTSISGAVQYPSITDTTKVTEDARTLLFALGSDNGATPDAQPYYLLKLFTGQGTIQLWNITPGSDNTLIEEVVLSGFETAPHPCAKLEENDSQAFEFAYNNGVLTFTFGDDLTAANAVTWTTNLVWSSSLIPTHEELNRIGLGYQDAITDTSILRGPRATFTNLTLSDSSTSNIHTTTDGSLSWIDKESDTENNLTLTTSLTQKAGATTGVIFGFGSDPTDTPEYTVEFSYNGSDVTISLTEPGTTNSFAVTLPEGSTWKDDLNAWNTGGTVPLWVQLADEKLSMGTGTTPGLNPFWVRDLDTTPADITHAALASSNGTVVASNISVANGSDAISTTGYSWHLLPNTSDYVRMEFTSSAEEEMYIGVQIGDDTATSYQFEIGAFSNTQSRVIRQGQVIEQSLVQPETTSVRANIREAGLSYLFEFHQGTARLSYQSGSGPVPLFHYTDAEFATLFGDNSITRVGFKNGAVPDDDEEDRTYMISNLTIEDAQATTLNGGSPTLSVVDATDDTDDTDTGTTDGDDTTDDTDDSGTLPFSTSQIDNADKIVFDFSEGDPANGIVNTNRSLNLPSFVGPESAPALEWELISGTVDVDMAQGFTLESEFQMTSQEGWKTAIIALKASATLPTNADVIRFVRPGNVTYEGCKDAAYVILLKDISDADAENSTLKLELYQPQAPSVNNSSGQAAKFTTKTLYLSSNVHTTKHILRLTCVPTEDELFDLKLIPKPAGEPDWDTVPESATWQWPTPNVDGTTYAPEYRHFTHAILSAWFTAITYENYGLLTPQVSRTSDTTSPTLISVPTDRYEWEHQMLSTALNTDENGGGGLLTGSLSINQWPGSELIIGFTNAQDSNISLAQPDYRIYLTPGDGYTEGRIEIQKGSGNLYGGNLRNDIRTVISNSDTKIEVGYIADTQRETRTFFIYANRSSTTPLTPEDAATADWVYTETNVSNDSPLRRIGFRSVEAESSISNITILPFAGPEPAPDTTPPPTAETVAAGSVLWGNLEAQELSAALDSSGGGQLITAVSFAPEADQTVEATIALTDLPTEEITDNTEPTYLLVVTPPTAGTSKSTIQLLKGSGGTVIEGAETGHVDQNSTPTHIWVRYLKRDTQNEFYVGFGPEVDFGKTVWRAIDTDIAETPAMLHFGLGAQGDGGAEGTGSVIYDDITVEPKPILTSITTNYEEMIWNVQGEITPLTKQLHTPENEYLGGLFSTTFALDARVLGQEFTIALTSNEQDDLGKLADYKLTLYPNSGEAGLEKRSDDTWSVVEGEYKSSSKVSGLTAIEGAPHKLWLLYMPLWNSREFMLGIWHSHETEPPRADGQELWEWAEEHAILKWSDPITPYDEDDPDTMLAPLRQFGVSTPAVAVTLNSIEVTPLRVVNTSRSQEQQDNADAEQEAEMRGTITEDGLPELSLWQNASSVHRIQAQSGAAGQRTITVSGDPDDRVILAFTKDAPGLTGAYVEEPEIAFRIIFSGQDRPESLYWPTRGLAITSENSLADNKSEQLRPEGRSYNIKLSEGEISVHSTSNPDLGYVWWNDDILEYATASGYTFGPWYFTVAHTEGALATLTGDDGGSYVLNSAGTTRSAVTVRRYA